MGNWVCKHRVFKVVFLGMEAVGKTSLLYNLKLGEVVKHTIPTLGHNIENIEIEGVEVELWDIISRSKARALWPVYFGATQGFVFVIDSTYSEDLQEVVWEIFRVLQDNQTQNTVVMVLANKQDKEGAMSAQELEDYLLTQASLRGLRSHTMCVMPCSALDVKQVSQVFTKFTHLLCLNQAGKLKRGLITLKEQAQMEEEADNKDSSLKHLLKDPFGYMKSFF